MRAAFFICWTLSQLVVNAVLLWWFNPPGISAAPLFAIVVANGMSAIAGWEWSKMGSSS